MSNPRSACLYLNNELEDFKTENKRQHVSDVENSSSKSISIDSVRCSVFEQKDDSNVKKVEEIKLEKKPDHETDKDEQEIGCWQELKDDCATLFGLHEE